MTRAPRRVRSRCSARSRLAVLLAGGRRVRAPARATSRSTSTAASTWCPARSGSTTWSTWRRSPRSRRCRRSTPTATARCSAAEARGVGRAERARSCSRDLTLTVDGEPVRARGPVAPARVCVHGQGGLSILRFEGDCSPAAVDRTGTHRVSPTTTTPTDRLARDHGGRARTARRSRTPPCRPTSVSDALLLVPAGPAVEPARRHVDDGVVRSRA